MRVEFQFGKIRKIWKLTLLTYARESSHDDCKGHVMSRTQHFIVPLTSSGSERERAGITVKRGYVNEGSTMIYVMHRENPGQEPHILWRGTHTRPATVEGSQNANSGPSTGSSHTNPGLTQMNPSQHITKILAY